MKTLLTRYMTWMLIAAATLLLFGLAQMPELWAPLT
jgi:Sec-independent protein translocase protein TatA